MALELLKNWQIGASKVSEWKHEWLDLINEHGIVEANPLDQAVPSDAVAHALAPLWTMKGQSFAFEIWSGKEPRFLLWGSNPMMAKNFQLHFQPIYPRTEFGNIQYHPQIPKNSYVCGATVKLKGEPFGLKCLTEFSHDPLLPFAHLGGISKDSLCIIQTVFRPLSRVSKKLKMALRRRRPNLERTPVRLFEAAIRLVSASPDPKTARELIELAASNYLSFEESSQLKTDIISFPLVRDSFRLLRKLLRKEFPRTGKLLVTPDELASFVHLPARLDMQGSGQPVPRPTHTRPRYVALGSYRGRHGGETLQTAISDLGSVYAVGSPGTGKTTFLVNLVLQAFEQGVCVFVIDPHGDMSFDLLERVKPSKVRDIVFLDPVRVGFSFNPLELPHLAEGADRHAAQERIIGDMTGMMMRLFGKKYWGPSLNRTFQNTLRVLYSVKRDPTFEDMLNVLLEKADFDSKEVREFQKEMSRLPYERRDAVLNKIDPFVKNRTLYNLLSRKSTVRLAELVQPGKLVVWRLPKSELTGPTLSMVGTGLITKLWSHILARGKEDRFPVMLVLDEFQNFAMLETPSVMLAEGRKYGLHLVAAHQHLQQLRDMEVGVQDLLANCRTKVIFRVSGEDAAKLARTMGPSASGELAETLTHLADGEAVVQTRPRFQKEPSPPLLVSAFPQPRRRFFDVDGFVDEMKEKFAPHNTPPSSVEVSPDLYDLLRAVYKLDDGGSKANVNSLKATLGKSGAQVSVLLDKAESSGLLERRLVKGRGKESVVSSLTAKGRRTLGIGVSMGGSAKAGGDAHRAMSFAAKEWLEEECGYRVQMEEQGGRREQPDLLAYPRDGDDWGEPLAVEIEVSGRHGDQVRKNYQKSARLGRKVLFVVRDERAEGRVKRALEGLNPSGCSVTLLPAKASQDALGKKEKKDRSPQAERSPPGRYFEERREQRDSLRVLYMGQPDGPDLWAGCSDPPVSYDCATYDVRWYDA